MKKTDLLYEKALTLYTKTELSVAEICRRTETPVKAFRAYLQRSHRDLLLARHGVTQTPDEGDNTRVRKQTGQSAKTRKKYQEAILACDDTEHIALNVSQIARLFDLDPTGLGNQLRNHYPEILRRREKERLRLGINDNYCRGARKSSLERYSESVKHLEDTGCTIESAADRFNLSYSGLRDHLIAYHKDLLEKRRRTRLNAL